MADSRTIAVVDGEWFVPRLNPNSKPTPPPWYNGTPVFTYGVNPAIAEPLNTVPLSYKFSSPFVEGDDIDSYFTYTKTSRDVRALNLSQDLAEIQDYPPTEWWTSRLPFETRPINGYLSKVNYGFAVYALDTYEGLNYTEQSQLKVMGLDVKSGSKALTKQDFALRIRPQWYSSYHGQNRTPALGGFSLHEVDDTPLSDVDSYNLVRKRVVVLGNDVSNGNQLPVTPNGGADYLLSTEPTLQFNVTGSGRYYRYFHPTRYIYPSASGTSFFKYYTDGGYTHSLCFVGEFSLKQLHDYLSNMDGIFFLWNAGQSSVFTNCLDPMHYAFIFNTGNVGIDSTKTGIYYSGGSKKKQVSIGKLKRPVNIGDTIWEDIQNIFFMHLYKGDFVYSSNPDKKSPADMLTLSGKFEQTDVLKCYYYKGSYYAQTPRLGLPNLVTNGNPVTPKDNKVGLYQGTFFGLGKIEAYTFDGAAPTPYKPIYLYERNTGSLIKETISDSTGKYVLHALPLGVEFIAVSVDPTKTMNSTIEEFGALE